VFAAPKNHRDEPPSNFAFYSWQWKKNWILQLTVKKNLHSTVDSEKSFAFYSWQWKKILRNSLRFKIYNYKFMQNVIAQDEAVCCTYCCNNSQTWILITDFTQQRLCWWQCRISLPTNARTLRNKNPRAVTSDPYEGQVQVPCHVLYNLPTNN